jgi:adenylosuccinate lyase
VATENLLMAAARAGFDRQDIHEKIRAHALAAAARLKEGAGNNDLISRLAADPSFPKLDFSALLEPRHYVGRAPEQVRDFIAGEVEPIRRRYPGLRARPRDVDV